MLLIILIEHADYTAPSRHHKLDNKKTGIEICLAWQVQDHEAGRDHTDHTDHTDHDLSGEGKTGRKAIQNREARERRKGGEK